MLDDARLFYGKDVSLESIKTHNYVMKNVYAKKYGNEFE